MTWNSSLGGSKKALSGAKKRIGIYAGQYFDSETGLHYNYHRYYDPKTGRYLTPDPIGFAGGINSYLYTFANPIKLIDPLGLAGYLVSWTSVSGSKRRMGGTHITGVVIALDRNSNNLHNAVAFSGTFAGISLGLPAGGSNTRSQIFTDSYERSDVTRIQGYSSFTSITVSLFGRGGITWGLYAFGDLGSASDTFSEVEAFELSFSSMQGDIELNGTVYEVTTEFLNELLGLENSSDTNCE